MWALNATGISTDASEPRPLVSILVAPICAHIYDLSRHSPFLDSSHRTIRSACDGAASSQVNSSTVAVSSHWPGSALNHPSSSSSSSSFSSPMLPSGYPATTVGSCQPSGVDEFPDYSAAERCHHRRSVSDSIAFLEAAIPLVEDDGSGSAGEFDRFDDDQLSIFLYEMADVMVTLPPPTSLSGIPTLSASQSSPSDHNINNEEKPAGGTQTAATNEPEEAQSAYKMDMGAAEQPGVSSETIIVDPKRVKRILANRQSAQRSRVRKLQYISELERSVNILQSQVSALSPRVAFLDHQRTMLTLGNSQLKQRIAGLAQDKISKDAHQEALRKEIGRLRQVYEQQNLKKMATPNSESIACIEKELLS